MNVAKPLVRRPVMTTLVMLGVLLLGIIGYRLVRANNQPDMDPAIIVVTAGLPGATPEAMELSVATPLERQFSTITGLDTMTSTNTIGNTRIILQFQPSRNSDAAAHDVQSAIGRTLSELPANMPSPPSYRRVSPEDLLILYLLWPAVRYVKTFTALGCSPLWHRGCHINSLWRTHNVEEERTRLAETGSSEL